jgi:hypothetical protein
MEITLVILIYFLPLSFILTNKRVSDIFKKFHFYLMKVFGGVLVFSEFKIFFDKD